MRFFFAFGLAGGGGSSPVAPLLMGAGFQYLVDDAAAHLALGNLAQVLGQALRGQVGNDQGGVTDAS